MSFEFNPELDLILERTTDLPAKALWDAWTTPALMKEWFCPKPWKLTNLNLDLRPGAVFHSVMQGPEGESHTGNGCFLEVVPGKKLVWTDFLLPDYRPNTAGGFFTCRVTFEELNGKTKYTAIACHKDAASKQAHQEMGFETGWGICFDQLVELMKKKM